MIATQFQGRLRKYEFIGKHLNIFPVEKMCHIIKVSSIGFYKWLNRPESNREKKTAELSALIEQEFENSRQIYGSPRITQELKKLNLRSKIRKKYKVTTDSSHSYQVAENLLQRDFSVDALSQKWVGDITYIKTACGWAYLTTVIDLADRKVIGWSFSNDMTASNTTAKALEMAIRNRGVKPGLIFHSDRGIQYACDEFKIVINENSIRQSMSRKGNCWDNSVAESFFKTIKTECIYHHKFIDMESAKLEVFRYIEGFYPTKRIHSAIGYKTPNQMESFYHSKQKLAA